MLFATVNPAASKRAKRAAGRYLAVAREPDLPPSRRTGHISVRRDLNKSLANQRWSPSTNWTPANTTDLVSCRAAKPARPLYEPSRSPGWGAADRCSACIKSHRLYAPPGQVESGQLSSSSLWVATCKRTANTSGHLRGRPRLAALCARAAGARCWPTGIFKPVGRLTSKPVAVCNNQTARQLDNDWTACRAGAEIIISGQRLTDPPGPYMYPSQPASQPVGRALFTAEHESKLFWAGWLARVDSQGLKAARNRSGLPDRSYAPAGRIAALARSTCAGQEMRPAFRVRAHQTLRMT